LGKDPVGTGQHLRPLDLMRKSRNQHLPPHQIDLNTNSAIGCKPVDRARRPTTDQIVDEPDLLDALEAVGNLVGLRRVETCFDAPDDPDVGIADD
jgi:hypothetical protein